MPVTGFTFNPLGENTYIVHDAESKDAIIIDAGMYNPQECHTIQTFLEERSLKLNAIWGTHAHIDHIFGNCWIKEKYQIPYYLHKDDIKMIERSETMAALWNLNYTPSPLPNEFLQHDDQLTIGSLSIEVRFVPGHAPGHVVFYCPEEEWAVVGDTIFQGSIGRTDLPGGNHELLLRKIQEEIFTLPDETTLYTGHGSSTTVAFERENNPFFN